MKTTDRRDTSIINARINGVCRVLRTLILYTDGTRALSYLSDNDKTVTKLSIGVPVEKPIVQCFDMASGNSFGLIYCDTYEQAIYNAMAVAMGLPVSDARLTECFATELAELAKLGL